MKNIHITLTEFRHESRVLKEIASLESSGVFESFTIIALGADDLPVNDSVTSKVGVRRVNLNTRKLPKSSPFQLVKFIEFMYKCFMLVKREEAQVVNVHTLALLPLGWLLKTTLKLKLVYDAHELETERHGLLGVRKKISKCVERIFIYACDLVIVVGDNIADWYASAYSIDRPLVVKNVPKLRPRIKKDLLRNCLGIQPEQKILLYQGGLANVRGIQLMLDAFKARKANDIVVVFMGYGDLATEVEYASKTHANIFYLPAVPPSHVLDYTASADIGISAIENSCLSYYYCMPNKLYEYAMAGLPVIVSNMKEMANAVKEADFGIVFFEYSVLALNAAVDRLASRDLSQLSENAYQFARLNAWEVQEKIMLAGYQRMFGK